VQRGACAASRSTARWTTTDDEASKASHQSIQFNDFSVHTCTHDVGRKFEFVIINRDCKLNINWTFKFFKRNLNCTFKLKFDGKCNVKSWARDAPRTCRSNPPTKE